MSVSFQYLERCSAETGFQVDPLEKVVRSFLRYQLKTYP